MPAPSHIAVLGGGITGLSSAFHLSRRFPNSLITIVEKESRLGGWVRSERVQVRDDLHGVQSDVVLEAGPRTLRPNAKSVLELVHLLDLKTSIVSTPTTSPAAKTRFLYMPGTQGLLPLPSSFSSLVFSPFRSTLLPAILRDFFRPANRPHNKTDESFDAFLTRRFGEAFARTFGSALVHGIYAADSRKLSVRAAFPALWDAEERGRGSVVSGLVKLKKELEKKNGGSYVLGDMGEMMDNVSVYSFRDGMGTLTDALEKYLRGKDNVRVLLDTDLSSLRLDEKDNFKLTTTSGTTITPTHIVSSIPLPVLHSLLAPSTPLPHLTTNPSSSVSVINLVFSNRMALTNIGSFSHEGPPVPPQGFGYLIPRATSDYHPTNPGILGTIFDSRVLSSQDTPDAVLTKLTIMMGGPHHPTPTDISVNAILQDLMTHFDVRGISKPLLTRVHHHQDCIPMLLPGHLERMTELWEVLQCKPWEGRMEIVGAGVGGVSVGDCVEAARRVGESW